MYWPAVSCPGLFLCPACPPWWPVQDDALALLLHQPMAAPPLAAICTRVSELLEFSSKLKGLMDLSQSTVWKSLKTPLSVSEAELLCSTPDALGTLQAVTPRQKPPEPCFLYLPSMLCPSGTLVPKSYGFQVLNPPGRSSPLSPTPTAVTQEPTTTSPGRLLQSRWLSLLPT